MVNIIIDNVENTNSDILKHIADILIKIADRNSETLEYVAMETEDKIEKYMDETLNLIRSKEFPTISETPLPIPKIKSGRKSKAKVEIIPMPEIPLPVPEEVIAPMTYVQLTDKVATLMAEGKITKEKFHAIVKSKGVEHPALLAARLDLIPQVWEIVEEMTGG